MEFEAERNVKFERDKWTTKKITLTVILVALLVIALITISVLYHKETTQSSENSSKQHDRKVSNFFHLSDTHLDLYYNDSITNANNGYCRFLKLKDGNNTVISPTTAIYGRIGCDSPKLLLESLVRKMKEVTMKMNGPLAFILITGDQSAHEYHLFNSDHTAEENIVQSVINSTELISQAFPDVTMIPTLGNNDLPTNYGPPTQNTSIFYSKIRKGWEPLIFKSIKNKKDIDTFQNTFDRGGYYSFVFKDQKLRIVVLNTMYWSTKAFRRNPNITIIGDIQMKWLVAELERANSNGERVIITGHIPPGYSTYPGEGEFYCCNYTTKYVQLTTDTFSHVIVGQLYGHTHNDKLKMQYLDDSFPLRNSAYVKKAFLLTAPSLTPIDGNNPSFRVMEFDVEKNVLADYIQYYLDLTLSNALKKTFWRFDYRFSSAYKQEHEVDGEINANTISRIIVNFVHSSSERDTWIEYSMHLRGRYRFSAAERFIEYCTSSHVSSTEVNSCLHYYKNIGT